jgi:tripartite-type tricarboxylate transporter receptor subunit TctC
MLCRRRFVASLALAPFAKFGCDSAAAAEWPQRPVRILYPYAAGSAGDTTARLIARRLSGALGQQFLIETRPGANGAIATEAVARSPADGYTLLWAITPPIAIAGCVRSGEGFHPDQCGGREQLCSGRQPAAAGDDRRRVH